jgi:hypothetical protein
MGSVSFVRHRVGGLKASLCTAVLLPRPGLPLLSSPLLLSLHFRCLTALAIVCVRCALMLGFSLPPSALHLLLRWATLARRRKGKQTVSGPRDFS